MLKRFQFRLIPFIACVIVCAIGISLGNWQTRRAEEKQAKSNELAVQSTKPAYEINGNMPAKEMTPYRPIKARGEWVKNWPIYLDNRPLNGIAGFYVMMPFKLEKSEDVLLVIRGWAPRNPSDRTKMTPFSTPEGLVEIKGIIKLQADRVMQLGNAEKLKAGAIVQNISPQSLATQTGWKVMHFLFEQHSDNGDGLKREWPSVSFGIDKHKAYAFQWYGLALMTLIFFVVTGIRRERK